MSLPEKCPQCECPMVSGMTGVRWYPVHDLNKPSTDSNQNFELYNKYSCMKCDFEWEEPSFVSKILE